MAANYVTAKKGNLTRKFTQTSWDHMGKEDSEGKKHGWKRVSDVSVSSSIPVSTEKPGTGQSTVKVENAVARFETLLEQSATFMNEGNLTQALLRANEALSLNPESKVAKRAIDEIESLINKKMNASSKPKTGEPGSESGSGDSGSGEGGNKNEDLQPVTDPPVTDELTEEQKKFIDENLKDFTKKSEIKNFLNGVNVPISNKDDIDVLKVKLARYVDFNVNKLKEILE